MGTITPKKLKKLVEAAMADPLKELAIVLHRDYGLNEEEVTRLLNDKELATIPYPTALKIRNYFRDIKVGLIKIKQGDSHE